MGFLDLLDPADRLALTRAGRSRHSRRGATVIVEGDHSDSVFVLLSGWVKVTNDLPDGREIVLNILGPGNVLGEWEAIDPAIGQRIASNIALQPLDCRVLTAAEFTNFLQHRPAAAIALIRNTIHGFRKADRRRVEAGSLDVAHRLARFLIELGDQHGRMANDGLTIDVPLTQDELASIIGASRESVVRALSTLRSRGLITTGRRQLSISNPDRLRRYVE